MINQGILTKLEMTANSTYIPKPPKEGLANASANPYDVLHSLPDAVAILDSAGTILYANPSWRAAQPACASPGDNYLQFLRKTGETASGPGQKALSGIQRVLAGQQNHFEMKYDRPAEPSTVPVWIRVCVLERDDAGRIVITETQLPEKTGAVNSQTNPSMDAALRESEEKYRSLFEESRDAIYISSPEGKLLDINPAGVKMLGYPGKEELLDIYLSEALYVDPRDRLAMMQEFERHGQIKDYEVKLKRKDGRQIIVQNTASAVYDSDGTICAFRGILRDVTHFKQLQKQLLQSQKMEAIGTLAGGIAHDFNNILGALLGYAELLRTDLPEGTRGRSNLEQIIVAGLRAKELVKQILTFSHQVEQEFGEVQLSKLVKEVLKLLRASLPPSIEIKTELRDEDGVVVADATQMHQVLMNLCTNAYHAMEEGGGTLTIELDKEQVTEAGRIPGLQPGTYLKLTVCDTGCGMDSDTIRHIFDPFYTTKPPGQGTGLGLAVVHGILKSHGGFIHVSSEAGKGSTFEIFLPRIEKCASVEICGNDEISAGSGHILFIDDETSIVESGKQLLAWLGYTITPCLDPLLGLEMFNQQPEKYDLVITDYSMPKMNGLALSRKLREIRKDIPIILMSGSGDAMVTEKNSNTGVNEILLKPLITQDFAKAINRVLHHPAGKEARFEKNTHR